MASSSELEVPFGESVALNSERLSPRRDWRPDCSKTQPSIEIPTFVPGEPTLSPADVNSFLLDQLGTPLLDELYHRLWLVAKKSGCSINTLHVHTARGRSLVPSEDPRLHLVWRSDRIYIKPIPVCLLNYQFWVTYLQPTDSISNPSDPQFDRAVALGFLRTYAFLIQHKIDFIMAQKAHLIPDDVDWVKWSKFIQHFRTLEDHHVAKRYHYGQLRLSRLNWAVRCYRPRHADTCWFYELPHWSVREFVGSATLPLIFVFATLSVVLSAMQVVVSVPKDALWFPGPDSVGYRSMSRAFWVFCIGTLLLSGIIWVLLFWIPLAVLLWQISWGYRQEKKRSKGMLGV